jgi:hypothetical protein
VFYWEPIGVDMKIGDLIQVDLCSIVEDDGIRRSCGCFLCEDDSNRIGLVIKRSEWRSGRWLVLFDVGDGWVNDDTLFTVCS